jgi:hypothetical protein
MKSRSAIESEQLVSAEPLRLGRINSVRALSLRDQWTEYELGRQWSTWWL